MTYKRADNELSIFADDAAPRWLTSACPVDANTLVGGDKFGNIYICRLPQEVTSATVCGLTTQPATTCFVWALLRAMSLCP